MAELIAMPEREEPDYPKYSDPGEIVLQLYGPAEPYASGAPSVYRWSFDMIDHDGCTFWIQEGEGFEYWVDQLDFPHPGYWVIPNITGTYHRGEWGFTDDDVDWDHEDPRPARWSDLPCRPPLYARIAGWFGIDLKVPVTYEYDHG